MDYLSEAEASAIVDSVKQKLNLGVNDPLVHRVNSLYENYQKVLRSHNMIIEKEKDKNLLISKLQKQNTRLKKPWLEILDYLRNRPGTAEDVDKYVGLLMDKELNP